MTEVKRLLLKNKVEGRRLALSDIHGCTKTFKALLKQINLKKRDQLFILGDAINRGPSSNKVLDEIIDLKKNGFEVYYIRGNHEQIVIDAIRENKFHLKLLAPFISKEKGLVKNKYVELLENTFHYIELEDYFLVHAGFDFSSKMPFENTHAMMYSKKFKLKHEYLDNRKVVIGHYPSNLTEILRRLKKGKNKIYIDNGCVNSKVPQQGNLLCLNLDTLAVSIQKNIE